MSIYKPGERLTLETSDQQNMNTNINMILLVAIGWQKMRHLGLTKSVPIELRGP